MSINDIFVDNRFVNRLIHMQNCIAHILYYIYSDWLFLCTVQLWPNQWQIVKGARAHHLAIYSSISLLPSMMSLRTVAHRNMSTTRLYCYYRGKNNSYREENFYRYIANDKISPIPIIEWPFIVVSLRHTCAIIMLSNEHLDMPHQWGGWIISAKEKYSLTQI